VNLGGSGRQHLEKAAALLERKKPREARLVQMEIEDFRKSFTSRVLRRINRMIGEGRLKSLMPVISAYRRSACRSVLDGATFREAIRPLGAGDYGTYLENRFSHPSLLAAMPVIALFPALGAERILDLGCGAGHHAYVIASFAPEAQLTCVDKSFINLCLARRFMVPDARLICHNLDHPLPFDEPFDVVFSSDVLHYVDRQKETAAEAIRAVKPEGYLFLCHLHNALVFNFVPGRPLDPAQWSSLFEVIPHRIFPEDGILKDFVLRNRFDLGEHSSEDALRASNGLILAGSRKHDVSALSIDDPFERLLERNVQWIPNPIYRRVASGGERDTYEFSWFSEGYRTECPQLEEIMAGRIELPAGFEPMKPVQIPRDELLGLAKQLAVVNVPDHYA
jgi:SAM-dependent methyltransferase